MKKWIPVIGATAMAIALFVGGCSNSSSSDSGPQFDTVNLSGTLTFAGSSASLATVVPENHALFVQNRVSKRVYNADIGSDGSFSVNIEKQRDTTFGNNFVLCIIQKDPLEFKGIIMTSSANSEGVSGFDISDSVSNFNVNFNLDDYSAFVNTFPDNVTGNTEFKVRLDGDRPIGANNGGAAPSANRGSRPLNTENSIDRDEDGVPDIFDGRNNGVDIDNKDADNMSESVVFSDALQSLVMFMNLKIDEEFENSYTVSGNSTIVIEARPSDPGSISAMEVDLLHTSFTTATLDQKPGGYTDVNGLHTEGSAWLTGGQRLLHKMTSPSGETVYTVLFHPNNNDFGPGALVRVKVTMTDGSVEYYFTGINFKFQTIVDHTSSPSDSTTDFVSGSGSRSVPYVMDSTTGNVTLTWSAPTDENGDSLTGLTYQIEVFYYDSSESQVGDRVVLDVGEDVLTYTIPASSIDLHQGETPAPAYLQWDITARYPYGDNSANKIYVKRSSW